MALLLILNICSVLALGYAQLTGGYLFLRYAMTDKLVYFVAILLAARNAARCLHRMPQYLRGRRYRALVETGVAAAILVGFAWSAHRFDPGNEDKVIRTFSPAPCLAFVLVVALAMFLQEWRRNALPGRARETTDSRTPPPSTRFLTAALLVSVAGIGLGIGVWFWKFTREPSVEYPWQAIAQAAELLFAVIVPIVAFESLAHSYSLAGKRYQAATLRLVSAAICGALVSCSSPSLFW